MNYTIEPLDRTCNQALLALAKTTDTGSGLFTVDRTPDFFSLADEWGEPRYFGALRGGELIGCVGVTAQTRFLSGQPKRVYYLHDLRVHPSFRGGRVYVRLVRHLMDRLRKETGWVFATILDSNSHRSALTRGEHVFPKGIPLGHTLHLGIPLFWPQPGDWRLVRPLSPHEAWEQYELFARTIDFAFADRERFFHENGDFLGVCDGKKVLAVCKIVDQAASRRLISAKPLSAALRCFNVVCRLRGTPGLPGPGEAFAHGYLSFYATRDGTDYRRHFFAYLSKHRRNRFTYVFTGLPGEAARSYRNPTYIKLSSTTFAYGDVPEGLQMQAHELTMI
jgi:GNAT superfamily N-acetyltransferase